MCSQAMANARHTPIPASPSANIAGSQTNTFITASYVPRGASAQGSGSFGKWRTGAEAQPSALAAPHGAAGWRQPRSTVPSLSRHVSRRSASSKRRKLAILIWLLGRKDPIRTQATARPMALSAQMLTAPPTVVGLGQDRPVPIVQRLVGDRPPGRDVCAVLTDRLRDAHLWLDELTSSSNLNIESVTARQGDGLCKQM